MQENIIKNPSDYDWSEFQLRERGFMKHWAIDHGFSYVTLIHLVTGVYTQGSGPRIKQIIAAALDEGLVIEQGETREAA